MTPVSRTRVPHPLLLAALAALLLVAGCSSPEPAPPAAAPGNGPSASPPRPPATPGPPRTTPTPAPTSSASPAPSDRSASPSAPGTTSPRKPPGTRPGPAPVRRIWRPRPGTAWQWQLNGRVDPGTDVPVYDIDGFENSAADVAGLHAEGRKVICYINAGAWEDFRPDRGAFPKSVLGGPNGWDGERWLDIRQLDVLRPLMERRFDMCRSKGFDAVEPDLMDAYLHDTGFPLTAAHQLAYNKMLSSIARSRGLAVGLKNDLAQIPQLVVHFDFAVNEQCAEFDECAALRPFVAAGKAVFHVEYDVPNAEFCTESKRLGLSSMRKKLELDPWRKPC